MATIKEDSALGFKPEYWVYAGFIPLILFILETLRITSYWPARAPNVVLSAQLAMTFAFFGLWVFVPRIIWVYVRHNYKKIHKNARGFYIGLLGIGTVLSSLHLLLLSVFWRIMFFPEANQNRSFVHWIHTFGDVWLANIGFWILGFAGVACIVTYFIFKRIETEPTKTRYEVRQNGKLWSIPYSDIYWIKAAGNYVEIHTETNVLMIRKSLATITSELASEQFLSPHRTSIVNGNHVLSIKPRPNGSSFLIQLSNGDEAPLSRRRLSTIREALKLIE